MVLASIPNSTICHTSNAKKKRLAKLKQCKLFARRQQWLTQVTNNGCLEESIRDGEVHSAPMHVSNSNDRATGAMEITAIRRENDGSVHNSSDSDSSSNTRNANTRGGSNCSGTNFTESSRSDSSVTSYMGSVSEEGDDHGLDDWEAVADALATTEDKKNQCSHKLESPMEDKDAIHLDTLPEAMDQPASTVDVSKLKPENFQAWKPNDASRPRSLPDLLKHQNFPIKSNMHYRHRGISWGWKYIVLAPSPCPVCCEDLDMTDLSFFPCPCGFQLCLFCHKRISEEDGRCPGCRTHYDIGAVKGRRKTELNGGCATLWLARSGGM